MISTCWGAGRRTDRFSDGIKPLQLRERPLAAVPLLPLYRKTRVEGTISSGGGAALGCMNDLVVAHRTAAVESTVPLDSPRGGFSPPGGRLARGCKPPAFSRFLFQSAVKSAESF